MSGQNPQPKPRHRQAVWLTGLVGGLIALALWGKLRFVSDVPRMAYAVPEVESAEQADADAAKLDGGDRSSAPTP